MNILIIGKNSFLFKNLKLQLEKKYSLFFINEKKFLIDMDIVKIKNLLISKKIKKIINFISDNNNSFENDNIVESFNSNIKSNLYFLETIIKYQLKVQYIYFSSLDKNNKNYISLYHLNKSYIEDLIILLNKNLKFINFKIIKLNPVIGPNDNNLNRLIPYITSQLKRGNEPNIELKEYNFIHIDEFKIKFLSFLENNQKILKINGKKTNTKKILDIIKVISKNNSIKYEKKKSKLYNLLKLIYFYKE